MEGLMQSAEKLNTMEANGEIIVHQRMGLINFRCYSPMGFSLPVVFTHQPNKEDLTTTESGFNNEVNNEQPNQ